MKKVPITMLFSGEFFYEGKKYKTKGYANSRIICHELNNPENEMQFSAYSDVEVGDEEAIRCLEFIKIAKSSAESRLKELEEAIKSLESQGVKQNSNPTI
jgi:hypothetical protein